MRFNDVLRYEFVCMHKVGSAYLCVPVEGLRCLHVCVRA